MTITVKIIQNSSKYGKHSVSLEFDQDKVTYDEIIERLDAKDHIPLIPYSIVLKAGDIRLDSSATFSSHVELSMDYPGLCRRVKITDINGVRRVLSVYPTNTVQMVKARLIRDERVVADNNDTVLPSDITLSKDGAPLRNETEIHSLGDGDLALTFEGKNGVKLKAKAQGSKSQDTGKSKNQSGSITSKNINNKVISLPQSLCVGFGAGAVLRFCHLAATSPKTYSSHIKSSLICGVGIGLGVMGVHALYNCFAQKCGMGQN